MHKLSHNKQQDCFNQLHEQVSCQRISTVIRLKLAYHTFSKISIETNVSSLDLDFILGITLLLFWQSYNNQIQIGEKLANSYATDRLEYDVKILYNDGDFVVVGVT